MAGVSSPQSLRDLFSSGTANGLADADLLARFRSSADDVAFETLVARHGPMVWRVCRDLLIDDHAAEDAFQATFLVLVRKAGSVRVDDSLGRWLYAVAWRVAKRSRADRLRRQKREAGSPVEPASAEAPGDADRRELRAIVQHELAQLPERFRAPIVLCHLEGLSHEEAARQLRCPVGTVRSRLARGRDRLRDRLARLGSPAVSLPVLKPAAVPARLLTATVQSSVGWLKSTSLVSASVASLAKGALIAMTFAQIKGIATGLAAVGLVGIAGTALVAQPGTTAPGPSASISTEAPSRLAPDEPAAPTATADPPSAGELAIRLQYAEERMRLTARMQESGQISAIETLKAREEVAILQSRLDDQVERLQEAVDVLKIEKRQCEIELRMANANVRLLSERVEWVEKLRKQNSVAPAESADAITKLDQAKCDVEVKELRLLDAGRRVDRAERRLAKLKTLQDKKTGPQSPTPPPGAPEGR